MSIILQFYPNGEFTQGVDTSSRRKSRPERISDEMTRALSPYLRQELIAEMNAEMYDADIEKGQEYISASGSQWIYLCRHDRTYYYAVDNHIDEPWTLESPHSPSRLVGMGEITPLPLVHQTVEFSQEPHPSRKKCLRMTSSMARNIRNACYVLEQQYTKDCLSFLTLTLPDLSKEGLQVCAENWGKMVDQFLKWLRDRTESKGFPLEYVYCTEIQSKRSEKYGVQALHLHLLFRGKPGARKPWVVSPKQVRKAWARCIKSVCSEPFQVCSLENLQRVRRSAGAYMSKYLSKGTRGSDPSGSTSDGLHFRGHWGGMGRRLSQFIKRAKTRIGGSTGDWELANMLTTGLRRGVFSRHLSYYKEGFVCTRPGNSEAERMGFVVAVGCLRKPTMHGGVAELIEYAYSIGDQLVG